MRREPRWLPLGHRVVWDKQGDLGSALYFAQNWNVTSDQEALAISSFAEVSGVEGPLRKI